MKKYNQLILGTILGSCGFFYSNLKIDGRYKIGVKKYEEIAGIVAFSYCAYVSEEEISTIMLQLISGWHITCLVHSIANSNKCKYAKVLS
jgi:hypothetical protein